MAAILKDHPKRADELIAYQTTICKASPRYRWPSSVVYDTTFRQEMAGMEGASMSTSRPKHILTMLHEPNCQQGELVIHLPDARPLSTNLSS